MNSSKNNLPLSATILLAGVYGIVAGHDRLGALLEALLRPDLSSGSVVASLLGSVVVQLAVGAFWVPVAMLAQRVGLGSSAVRLGVWAAMASIVLRLVAELAAGTRVGSYPSLLVAAAIAGTALVMGRGSVRTRARVARRVNGGMASLPGRAGEVTRTWPDRESA